MKKIYDYIDETGVASVKIIEGDKVFQGLAICHEEDEDFKSEKVGMTIAETRAELQFLAHIRDNELKPVVKSLQHLYGNMETSKYFNKHSYEATMIRRQLQIKKNELTIIKNEIAIRKKFLRNYIEEKEKLYIKLRQAKNN